MVYKREREKGNTFASRAVSETYQLEGEKSLFFGGGVDSYSKAVKQSM